MLRRLSGPFGELSGRSRLPSEPSGGPRGASARRSLRAPRGGSPRLLAGFPIPGAGETPAFLLPSLSRYLPFSKLGRRLDEGAAAGYWAYPVARRASLFEFFIDGLPARAAERLLADSCRELGDPSFLHRHRRKAVAAQRQARRREERDAGALAEKAGLAELLLGDHRRRDRLAGPEDWDPESAARTARGIFDPARATYIAA
jgi:hypothetical protein